MLSPHLISRLRKIDWDFTGSQSESLFSAIHWHPGRFASQLPATLIGLLSKPAQMVLDPFVGSGTTLVEAQRLSRHSIGIDLSPVACMITHAKTLTLSASEIKLISARLKEDCTAALCGLSYAERPPQTVQDQWYTAEVKRDLTRLWLAIQRYSQPSRVLADTAFSAILLPVCRETRHWGYVCDNSTPSGKHGGRVLEKYCETIDCLVAGYEDRDLDRVARNGKVGRIEEAIVICGDAREELKKLPAGSVDLVVTSPPYFGVSDYVKSQRLSIEWFGHQIEPLRTREIGARSKRHRSTAADQYKEELADVFRSVRRCLKTKGVCAVIIGESDSRESVLDAVIASFQGTGFDLVLSLNRRVSSQRRQAPSIVGEHVLFFSA